MFTRKKDDDDNPQDTRTVSVNEAQGVKPMTDNARAKSYGTKPPFPLNSGLSDRPDGTGTSRLHVGKDIHLKGEITACDRLVVEGKVEASMNSKEIEITTSGIFHGEVTIETADISGEFEGTLNARTRLIVRKTGRVSGIIEYGEIEIEPGGEIAGKLKRSGSKKALSDIAGAMSETYTKRAKQKNTEQPASQPASQTAQQTAPH